MYSFRREFVGYGQDPGVNAFAPSQGFGLPQNGDVGAGAQGQLYYLRLFKYTLDVAGTPAATSTAAFFAPQLVWLNGSGASLLDVIERDNIVQNVVLNTAFEFSVSHDYGTEGKAVYKPSQGGGWLGVIDGNSTNYPNSIVRLYIEYALEFDYRGLVAPVTQQSNGN